MSLFKKPKKNLRKRVADSDEEDDSSSCPAPSVKIENVAIPAEKPAKAKTLIKVEAKKTSSTLSFQEDLEGDDGVETFQIKKSLQSRRIAKRMEKERKMKEKEKEKEKYIVQPTEENVNELEEKQPCPSSPQLKILNGREAEMAGYESESEEELDSAEYAEGHKFRQPDPFRRLLESGGIPDAAMIHAARKKRQMARELGGGADFISLEDVAKFEDRQVSTARLVREDEHDKSDEEEGDEGGRVDFSVDLLSKDKQQRKEAFLAAEQEDEGKNSDEAEDEVENWETQQFRKAVGQRQIEAAQQEMAYQHFTPESVSSSSGAIVSTQETSSKGSILYPPKTIRAAPDLSKLAPQPTPQELIEKLRSKLTSVDEVHRRHVSDKSRLRFDVTSCQEENNRLELERPELSVRYEFFQEIRGYVHDLVDCLSTKLNNVEILEKKWTSSLNRRCTFLQERRRADIRDESSDCAVQPGTAKVDYPEKVSRTAEREARRRRRSKNRREAFHKEGLSSDDEVTDKEATSFARDKSQIEQDSRNIFSDTVEEFCSVEKITDRFLEWRLKDVDSYRDAYVDLFLPRLLTPIIRAQFLQDLWNPLEREVMYIKDSRWFLKLLRYDLKSEEDNRKSSHKDSEILTISKTVELAVIPYVAAVVRAAYDPCSTTQTNRIVMLIKTLMEDHPLLTHDTKGIQQLFKVAVEKFEGAIDQDVFIPWHFVSKSPLFVKRQFWSAAKLLRNILHWQDLISDSILRSLAVDKLLKNMLLALKMMIASNSDDPDTLDKVRYIAAALPKSWLGPLAPNAAQLQPLIDIVMALAKSSYNMSSTGRRVIGNIATVLRSLGAVAEAEEVLSKYS